MELDRRGCGIPPRTGGQPVTGGATWPRQSCWTTKLTAGYWEPDEPRGSRPVLRERGGETPPRHSPRHSPACRHCEGKHWFQRNRQKWKLGQPRSISVRLKLREIFYLSFRPPELGQPFWSFLLLVVSVQELKCLIPKFKLARNLTLPNSQNPSRMIQRGPSLIARYELALTRSTSFATEPITMLTRIGARQRPN